MIGIQTGSGC